MLTCTHSNDATHPFRYFTLSKGTVNIPPVFWYWEHCDKDGHGHSEKGSIQLVSGTTVAYSARATISIVSPERSWVLVADTAGEGTLWTTLLNTELARVAGRDAAEDAKVAGQQAEVDDGAVASDLSVYVTPPPSISSFG